MSIITWIIIAASFIVVLGGLIAWYFYNKRNIINGIKCHVVTENYKDSEACHRRYFISKIGEKEGMETIFYPSGEINKVQNWKHGKRHGSFVLYYRNGQCYIKGKYEEGELVNQEIN